ncbi:MAG: carbon-nitrogen hydrolase family protein [Gammaproteobacteria bacterium]|jgi:nitrilase
MTKLAIVQKAPVYLDKTNTIARAVTLVDEAAAAGAQTVIFSEAFIPGYPAWIWRLRPGGDWSVSEQAHARLLQNAVTLKSDDLAPLSAAARRHKVTIVCGLNERDDELSRSTLYNTVVVIGPGGALLNRHRKLMPTNPERMVWGFGDASGLRAVDTPAGRIGTLICWENYMPLARYALYAQGVEIYIAPTYDSGDAWIGTLQHIAREGRCWVVGSGNLIKGGDIPTDFPDKDRLYPDCEEWVNDGDSVVIAPGGEIIAGPLRRQEGMLFAEIDATRAATAKRALDVAGHYSRPDIFSLHINARPQSPLQFD